MPKHQRKDINMTGANDFDLPGIPTPLEKKEEPSFISTNLAPIESKLPKLKLKHEVVRLNLNRIPVVKVGFEMPENEDMEIELIAIKERKTKKDLLAEIVHDWLHRNKNKKV